VPPTGAERDEVQAACAQHQHLPNHDDLDPTFYRRAHLRRVAGQQLAAQQEVIEPVLDCECDKKRDKTQAK